MHLVTLSLVFIVYAMPYSFSVISEYSSLAPLSDEATDITADPVDVVTRNCF